MTRSSFSEYHFQKLKLFSRAQTVLSGIGRLSADNSLDQCPATVDSVARRAQLIADLSASNPFNRILLLGDDDLLGIALSCIGMQRITVIDLDERVLLTISEATSKKVQTFKADLRLGLPDEFRSSFNMVFTDPPYTLAGQLLFVTCALKSLSEFGLARILVCSSSLYLDDADQGLIEAYLESAGFCIERCFEAFNEYMAPPDIKCDLQHAGYHDRDTFSSDLRCFKRVSLLPIPPLPLGLLNNIYDYGEVNGST
jgi:predicted methyltransferase